MSKKKYVATVVLTIDEDQGYNITKSEVRNALKNAAYAFINGDVSKIIVRSVDED